jgi:uncharacterized protein with FMN-binding domain
LRRSLIVLFATVAGLVLVLSFHTTSESAAVTSPVSDAPSAVGGAAAPAAPTSTTMPAGAGPAPTSVATATVAAYTGTPVTNRYGTVQVRITMTGAQFTDVVALQMPSDRAHSQRLSAEAGPILRTEAIRAQSAHVDVVSGATFTSESYAQSLQAALGQASRGR